MEVLSLVPSFLFHGQVLKVASSFDAAEREAKALVIWIWWPIKMNGLIQSQRAKTHMKHHETVQKPNSLEVLCCADLWIKASPHSKLWRHVRLSQKNIYPPFGHSEFHPLLSFESNAAIDSSLKLSFRDGINESTLKGNQSDSVRFNFCQSPVRCLSLGSSQPSPSATGWQAMPGLVISWDQCLPWSDNTFRASLATHFATQYYCDPASQAAKILSLIFRCLGSLFCHVT